MTTAEDELRAVVDERVAAVAAKDAQTLIDRQAEDVLVFNVLPPLRVRGRQAEVDQITAWFDGYDGQIGYEVCELEVHADGDVGFCTYLYEVTGTLTSGDEVDMWVRATLGLRRTGGRWQIVHDHGSVPFDPQTGRALTTLEPS